MTAITAAADRDAAVAMTSAPVKVIAQMSVTVIRPSVALRW
jgi:hypothetical protein